MKTALSFLISYWFLINVFAQDIKFDKLIIEEGLTSVNAILIDHYGYRWFGGTHGLYRFDGSDFKIYTHSSLDSGTLSYNDVLAIYEDTENNIWVGTSNHGVNLYQRELETIVRFSHIPTLSVSSVTAIQEDVNGNIWIGTIGNGIFVLDQKSQLVARFNHNVLIENSLSNNDVFDFLLDDSDIFWVVTNSGKLDKFNPQDSSFIHYTLSQQSFFGVRSGQKLLEVDSNKIWVGTEGAGIYQFQKESGKFSNFRSGGESGLSNDIITGLSLDSNGNVWVTTDGGGLNQFNQVDNTFTQYMYDPADEFSLSNNASYSLFVDGRDRIWLGMGDGRVNISNDKPFDFIRAPKTIGFNVVVDTWITEDNKLWVATGGAGLDLVDLNTGNSVKRINSSSSPAIATNIILSVSEDADGYIWLGTFQGGVYKLDAKGRILSSFMHDDSKSNTISNDHIFDIVQDQNGNHWFATQGGGIDKYDPTTKSFVNYNTTNNSGLVSNRIQTLMADAKNRIWVGHFNGGLQVYAPSENRFVTIDLPGDLENKLKMHPIHAICQDGQGGILLGTGGLGFIQINGDLSDFTIYDADAGLPSNSVYGMMAYGGAWWLSTNNGIVRIDVQDNSIMTIDKSDGLLSGDFESGAISVSQEGQLYFGSKLGIVHFNPERLSQRRMDLNPVLSNLAVFNQPIEPGQKLGEITVLEQSLLYAEEIQLPYDHNNFSLSFSCPTCENPQKLLYRYKLTGIDEGWVKAGPNRRFINYSNVNAGNYELIIHASDDQGRTWSEARKLTVQVHPPFYMSIEAYLIYLVIFILLGFLIYIFIRGRIELRNELKFEKFSREKDNDLNKEKINFFTSISHEIRTPLTLILGHLEKLTNQKGLSVNIKHELAVIKKNGNRLLLLINQLLDFRKMESGQMKLAVSNQNIVNLTKEILLPFREFAIQKKVELKFEPHIDINSGWVDAAKIETIIYNLLSNALKFTATGGSIRLSLSRKKDEIIIQVSDSGQGIAKENLEKVFEPFYQGHAGSKYGTVGTGIGLALVKEVVELHHGKISVMSQEGQGTQFIVTIPVDRTKYQELEIVEVNPELTVEPENKINQESRTNGEMPDLQLLVIEDNLEILSFLEDSFKDKYKVIKAENGKEGLNKAFQEIPDLIISDVMMPEMDGIEMCRHLKKDIRTNHIPIVLLTARTGFTHEYSGLDTGADDYITKPFKSQLLNIRVHNLIQNRKLIHEKFKKELILQPSEVDVSDPNEKFLADLMQLVEENISNSELMVNDLAKNMGLSHSVLYRKIHALTNLSINDFIKSIRLKRAVQLLETGLYNISETSYKVGFSNPKYFSTCFKAEFGKSPTEFIQKNDRVAQ